MDDQENAPRGRRRRTPAAQVRAQMLQAAADVVLDSGLDVSLEALSLEDLIQLARVPRSSVYRQWPYKDAFIDDLLCHLAGPDGLLGSQGVFDQQTVDAVRGTIAANEQLLRTGQGRRALLCEIVRLGAGQNFRAHLGARMRMRTALMAAVGSSKNMHARGAIAAAIQAASARSRDNIIELLQYVMNTLGLRLRQPGMTVAQLQAAGAALIQGLALRHDVAAAAAGQQNGTGPQGGPPDQIASEPVPGPGLDGKTAEWTLAAIAYLGIVDAFLEPDPAFKPPPGN